VFWTENSVALYIIQLCQASHNCCLTCCVNSAFTVLLFGFTWWLPSTAHYLQVVPHLLATNIQCLT